MTGNSNSGNECEGNGKAHYMCQSCGADLAPVFDRQDELVAWKCPNGCKQKSKLT